MNTAPSSMQHKPRTSGTGGRRVWQAQAAVALRAPFKPAPWPGQAERSPVQPLVANFEQPSPGVELHASLPQRQPRNTGQWQQPGRRSHTHTGSQVSENALPWATLSPSPQQHGSLGWDAEHVPHALVRSRQGRRMSTAAKPAHDVDKQSALLHAGQTLTRSIKRAPDWQTLYALLEAQHTQPEFNRIHVAAAFTHLAHLEMQRQGMQSAARRLAQEQLFDSLAAAHSTNSWDLSLPPHGSFVRRSPQFGAVLGLLEGLAVSHAGQMRPREASSVLWAASSLHHRLRPVSLERLLQVLLDRLPDGNHLDIAQALWSLLRQLPGSAQPHAWHAAVSGSVLQPTTPSQLPALGAGASGVSLAPTSSAQSGPGAQCTGGGPSVPPPYTAPTTQLNTLISEAVGGVTLNLASVSLDSLDTELEGSQEGGQAHWKSKAPRHRGSGTMQQPPSALAEGYLSPGEQEKGLSADAAQASSVWQQEGREGVGNELPLPVLEQDLSVHRCLQLSRQLVLASLPSLTSLPTRALVITAHALANLPRGTLSPEDAHHLLRLLQHASPGMCARDLACTMASIAAVGVVPEEAWMRQSMVQTMRLLSGFKCGELSLLLNACAQMRFRPSPQLLLAITRFSMMLFSTCSMNHLVLLAWSLAELQCVVPQEWTEAMLEEVVERIEELEVQELCTLLYGLAKLKHQPDEQQTQAIMQRTEEILAHGVLTQQEVAGLCWAMATLKMPACRGIGAQLYASSFQSMPHFTNQELAILLWGMANVAQWPATSGWLGLARTEVTRRLNSLGPNQLPLAMWALARLGLKEAWHSASWMHQMWTAALPLLPAMHETSLTSLLHSTAWLGYVPAERFLQAFTDAVSLRAASMTPETLRSLASCLLLMRRVRNIRLSKDDSHPADQGSAPLIPLTMVRHAAHMKGGARFRVAVENDRKAKAAKAKAAQASSTVQAKAVQPSQAQKTMSRPIYKAGGKPEVLKAGRQKREH